MNDYSFGNFVSTLRLRRGLSQKELGALVGVSNKAVSKWENGAAKPQTAICRRLANVLGVTLDELLACKYQPAQNAGKGIFAMKTEIWKRARQRMLELYGETPLVEILERFEAEKLLFRDGCFIPVMSFFGALAKEIEADRGVLFARAEIGDSFAAWLLGATKVNPLPPHYYCSKCKRFELVPDALDGWDLPPKRCSCGEDMRGDGHRLPCAMLYENDLNGYEYIFPRKFRDRARYLLLETFRDSINVYRVDLKDSFDSDTEMYILLPDSVCSDIPPGTDTLDLDRNAVFRQYRQYTRISFLSADREELIDSLCHKTNWMPYQTDYLSPKSTDALKEGGAMQPYYDRLRARTAMDYPECDQDLRRDLAYNLEKTKCRRFSDLLKVQGICHGTYSDSEEQTFPRERFALREDMYDIIQQKLLARGIGGDGLAVKYTNLLRKGRLAERRISVKYEHELLSIGFTPEELEAMKRVLYLFPRAHVVNELQDLLILAWFSVNYPEEFRAELDLIMPE